MGFTRTEPNTLLDNPRTAFGELSVANNHPRIQIHFPYNLNTDLVDVRENASGTATQADSMAVIQTGAAANSSTQLLSKRPLTYAPGQGAIARFTTLYTTGVSNSSQIHGVGDIGDGFFFGFNGSAFSILRKSGGRAEIQTLTISVGAVTATGNITINVDSTAVVVAVVSGDTAREVAVKIAATDFDDTGLGWGASVNNSTVIFRARSDSDKTGTFSLVDTGTTGVVGTFAETVTGVSTTFTWVAQTSWNRDTFDGSGASGLTLDPTKGNVYEISYQWLGFGEIEFSIEDPTTGLFVLVHVIEYANANIVPSIQNPDLPIKMAVTNDSNTSNLTMKSASWGGFTQGVIAPRGPIRAASGSSTVVSTTQLPLLTIKNVLVYQSVENRNRVTPIVLSVSSDGTKPLRIDIVKDVVLTGPVSFSAPFGSVSTVETDTGATGFSGGVDVLSIQLGKTDSELLSLAELDVELAPGETITISAIASSGSGQEAEVSIAWRDLQ